MKKLFLFTLITAAAISNADAQYLFGTSVAVGTPRGFVRYNPLGNAQKTLIPSFEYYQPITTKDTLHKVMYIVVQNAGTSDTLISVNLATSGITKYALPKGRFGYPQYVAGKIMSVSSAAGMSAYDLNTRTATVTDAALKPTGVVSTMYDATGGRYLFSKRGPSSTVSKDTLFAYNMGTRAITTYLIDCAGTTEEMTYSPKSNKVVFMGSQTNTTNFGVYSYDLSTQQLTYETPLPAVAGGTLSDCATFDEVGNRYFAVRQTNTSGTMFSLIEYNLSTKTLVNHSIGAPGIGYGQFFNNAPLPVAVAPMPAQEETLDVFPNPAFGTLRLRLELHGKTASLNIADLTGKSVYEAAAADGNNALDITFLPAGKYVISVRYADRSVSRLFEKQ